MKAVCERMTPVLTASQPRSALLHSIGSQLLLCGVFKPTFNITAPHALNRMCLAALNRFLAAQPQHKAAGQAAAVQAADAAADAAMHAQHGGGVGGCGGGGGGGKPFAEYPQVLRASESVMREQAQAQAPVIPPFLQPHLPGAAELTSSTRAASVPSGSGMLGSSSSPDLQALRPTRSEKTRTGAGRVLSPERRLRLRHRRRPSQPDELHSYSSDMPSLGSFLAAPNGRAASSERGSHDAAQHPGASPLMQQHTAQRAAEPGDAAANAQDVSLSDGGIFDTMQRSAQQAHGALAGVARSFATTSTKLAHANMAALHSHTPALLRGMAKPQKHSEPQDFGEERRRQDAGGLRGRSPSAPDLPAQDDGNDSDSSGSDADGHGDSMSILPDAADVPAGLRLHGELSGHVVYLNAEHFDHLYLGVLDEGNHMGTRAAIKQTLGLRRRQVAAWDIIVEQWAPTEVRAVRHHEGLKLSPCTLEHQQQRRRGSQAVHEHTMLLMLPPGCAAVCVTPPSLAVHTSARQNVQKDEWVCSRAWNVQRRVSDFVYLQRMLARLQLAPATLPMQRTHPDEQTQNLTLFMEVCCPAKVP